jgi:DNA-binding NtrC family response regulator
MTTRACIPLLGSSSFAAALERSARKLAALHSPVLLLGEAGTGKREIARWLHDHGERAGGPFVDLECAGLSRHRLEAELFGREHGAFPAAPEAKPGLLECADRGTVFLDEIADVDPQVQPRLVQVLEEGRFRRLGGESERPIDVRLIAATRHGLARMVRENRFLSELYIRINTIPLLVPPLRDRRQDIPGVAEALLEELAVHYGRSHVTPTPEALRALQRYDWPGNLRELRGVLERAVLLCDGDAVREADLCALPPSRRAATELWRHPVV